MNQAIQTLAANLTISSRDLKRLERKFRVQHGEEADKMLERHLKRTWNDLRDRCRYLHIKTKDDPSNATTIMQVKSPPAHPPEPERVSKVEEKIMGERSGEREVMLLRQHWVAQRAVMQQAIFELREAGLQDRELWIMERRIDKLDAKLAAATGMISDEPESATASQS